MNKEIPMGDVRTWMRITGEPGDRIAEIEMDGWEVTAYEKDRRCRMVCEYEMQAENPKAEAVNAYGPMKKDF